MSIVSDWARGKKDSTSTTALFGGHGAGGASVAPTAQADAEKALAADKQTGEDLAKKYFADGSMGRLDEKVSPAMLDALAAKKAALGGLSPTELTAERELANSGTNLSMQQQLRQLRATQAAKGLKGGAALSAQAGVVRQGEAGQAENERTLQLHQLAQQKTALNDYESTQGAIDSQVRAAKQFNIDAANREAMGRATLISDYAKLGADVRKNAMSEWLGVQSAKAAADLADFTRQKQAYTDANASYTKQSGA